MIRRVSDIQGREFIRTRPLPRGRRPAPRAETPAEDPREIPARPLPARRALFSRPMTQTEQYRLRTLRRRGVESITLEMLDDRHWRARGGRGGRRWSGQAARQVFERKMTGRERRRRRILIRSGVPESEIRLSMLSDARWRRHRREQDQQRDARTWSEFLASPEGQALVAEVRRERE